MRLRKWLVTEANMAQRKTVGDCYSRRVDGIVVALNSPIENKGGNNE